MIILWLLDISCNDDIFVFFYILITIKRHSSDFFKYCFVFAKDRNRSKIYLFSHKDEGWYKKKYKDNKNYHILQLHIN